MFFILSSAWVYAEAQPFAPDYGGQVVLSILSDPKSFNPVTSKDAVTSAIISHVFEGLTTLNVHTLQPEPHLAKSWDVSADGLTWDFHLRRDVYWSDGVPFSADDVVFTYNDLYYNPEIPNSAADTLLIEGRPIEVQKIDDYTVRFILPLKFAPFLLTVAYDILPKHLLESIVREGRFNSAWGIDSLPGDIVGTGPFLLSSYQPGQRIVLKRNPDYWKKGPSDESLPYLDRLVYLIVQNSDVELLKFLDGEIDAISVKGNDFPLLKPREAKDHFSIYTVGEDIASSFLFFNQNLGRDEVSGKPFVDPVKLKWFSDVRFRKAVAHAIDRERMIEINMSGLGYIQHSPITPGKGFYHNPDVVKYDYDPQVARELLLQAGFSDQNGDGWLQDSEGHSVEFMMYISAGSEGTGTLAGIIKADLEAIGIKVNLKFLEFNTLVRKIDATFDWDAIVLGLTGGGPDPNFSKNVWISNGQLHMWYPRQPEPATAWEKRVDEIFNDGVQELDIHKRKELYDEFQYIISDQLPLIYLVTNAKMYAVRNRFGNLDPVLYGAMHNLEEIYVRSKN